VFTEPRCNCVNVVFIWEHDSNITVCSLTVLVTLLKNIRMVTYLECGCVFTDFPFDCDIIVFIW